MSLVKPRVESKNLKTGKKIIKLNKTKPKTMYTYIYKGTMDAKFRLKRFLSMGREKQTHTSVH